MTYHDFTPNGLPLLRHLEKALATSDPILPESIKGLSSQRTNSLTNALQKALRRSLRPSCYMFSGRAFSGIWNALKIL